MRERLTPERVYAFKILCGFFSIAFIALVMSADIDAFYDAGKTDQVTQSGSMACLCAEDDAQAAAVRAPLLAIASAFILLIQIIPISDLRWDRQFSACVLPASVIVGVLAGWHWLSAETSGAPGIYMIIFSVVAAILTAVILAYPFYQTLKPNAGAPDDAAEPPQG